MKSLLFALLLAALAPFATAQSPTPAAFKGGDAIGGMPAKTAPPGIVFALRLGAWQAQGGVARLMGRVGFYLNDDQPTPFFSDLDDIDGLTHRGTGDFIETSWVDKWGMDRKVVTEREQGETVRQRNMRHSADVRQTLEDFPKPPKGTPHRLPLPIWDRLEVTFSPDMSHAYMDWEGDGLTHRFTDQRDLGMPDNWFTHSAVFNASLCLSDFPSN